MTEKLFYRDSHLKEFTAEVLSCEKRDGHYEVELDRTAFFPEGGGQYADTGVLDEMQVCDVQEKDGRIFHIMKDRSERVLRIFYSRAQSVRPDRLGRTLHEDAAAHRRTYCVRPGSRPLWI